MRTGSACEHPSPSVPPFLGAYLAERETGVDPLKSVLGGFGSPTLCRQPGSGFNARKVSELK